MNPQPEETPDVTGSRAIGYPPQQQPRGWQQDRSDLSVRRKSPALACFLSFCPGLGQVYVGYYKVGFVHIAVFATLVSILASNPAVAVVPLLGLFAAFFFLYNVIDAGRRAALYNQALAGMEGIALPDDIAAPTLGGSLGGGIALIVVGLVLLSRTALGWSLDWVEDWWPLGPIAVGVWLVVRDVADRMRRE